MITMSCSYGEKFKLVRNTIKLIDDVAVYTDTTPQLEFSDDNLTILQAWMLWKSPHQHDIPYVYAFVLHTKSGVKILPWPLSVINYES